VNDNEVLASAPHLRVVELSGNFSQKAATGGVVSGQDPIRSFFDRLFESHSFECAVLVSKKGLFGKKDRVVWPQVIASADDAKGARGDLEKMARSGFEVVIGTSSTLQELETFFRTLGYQEAGKGTYASGDEYDPVRAAWDKEGFLRAVLVATKLCGHTLCVFSHDGDPVYLLAD
jgi:hypothetical protein